jgi:hypothetical protein
MKFLLSIAILAGITVLLLYIVFIQLFPRRPGIKHKQLSKLPDWTLL